MILVTGSTGQLGKALREQLGDKAIYLDRKTCDLSSPDTLAQSLGQYKFDLLINTAAYTQVDLAEDESERAHTVNAVAPVRLAEICATKKAKLIHFSTDYVFDGNSSVPYVETDATNPLGQYGLSKLEGEKQLLKAMPDALILRTSWVYGDGKNFVRTIAKFGHERDELKVVYDQVGTLTSAEDLARTAVAARELQGIYHFSNEGVCSWYDVAMAVKREIGFKAKITPILSRDYPTKARRPHFGVLCKSKLKKDLNIEIPYWLESLERYTI